MPKQNPERLSSLPPNILPMPKLVKKPRIKSK